MTKDELFKKINNCEECKLKYGKKPFFFEMKKQKVMLITACPSIQAMFRPLTSIRFFRTISVALFGDKNISPEYIRAFHDEIYWTHMHKCYNEEALKSGDFTKIPNNCMNEYINEEVNLLKPEITIAFGKVVAERLFQREISDDILVIDENQDPKWGSKVFIAGFPKTGTEKYLDKIRDYLFHQMKGFKFMEQYENGSWTTSLNRQQQNTNKGLRVNLDFEREAIEQLKLIPQDKSNNNSWLENVILPNLKNCETIVRLEFFIEDQIRTMLMEVFSHDSNWRILEESKLLKFNKRTTLDQKAIYDYLKNRWKEAFGDYFKYLIRDKNWNFKFPNGEKIDVNKINELLDKLREISKIRNHVIHNGGYATADLSRNSGQTKFKGIRWYVNLVYVTDEGIESVSKFTKDIISLISAHDYMRFQK
jgi:hypothetical protein